MTAATTEPEPTVRTLLLGTRLEDAQAAVHTCLAKHDVLGAFKLLSPRTREAAITELATVAARLLDVDVAELLIAGWRVHERLITAAEETLRSPGRREYVRLATHEISATRRPTVNVLIDGTRLCTLHFRLDALFVLEANAAVENAQLIEISAENALLTATFVIEVPTRGDLDILSREQPIRVPPIVRMSVGVPLIPAAPPIPAEPV
jgi:hypothetical protein